MDVFPVLVELDLCYLLPGVDLRDADLHEEFRIETCDFLGFVRGYLCAQLERASGFVWCVDGRIGIESRYFHAGEVRGVQIRNGSLVDIHLDVEASPVDDGISEDTDHVLPEQVAEMFACGLGDTITDLMRRASDIFMVSWNVDAINVETLNGTGGPLSGAGDGVN